MGKGIDISWPSRLGASALLVVLAGSSARAESLCAYHTESGAIIYTNTPTNDGRCASAESPAPVAPAPANHVARYEPVIEAWAQHYGVSSMLVHAVVSTESAYRPGAVSNKGAQGLMQLMPTTARHYGVKDSFNVDENVRGGVALLRDLLDSFGGDTKLAVAAYNAGRQAVIKYSGVPPYKETQNYVSRVLGKLRGNVRGLTRARTETASGEKVQMRIDPTGGIALVN